MCTVLNKTDLNEMTCVSAVETLPIDWRRVFGAGRPARKHRLVRHA